MRSRLSRRDLGAVRMALALAAVAAGGSGARGTALNTNLIVNPGGESPAGASNFTSTVAPTGWTTTGNFTVVKYSIGAAGDLNSADSTAVGGGNNYFAGGPGTASGAATATQTINIADLGVTDANGYVGSASALLGGWGAQADNMTLNVRFNGVGGQYLNDFTLGPVTNADRGNDSKLLPLSRLFDVPRDTAEIVLTMTSTRVGGSASQYVDGYADNLSLKLDNTRTVKWTGAAGDNQWKQSANWMETTTNTVGFAPTSSAYRAQFSGGGTASVLVNGARDGGTIAVFNSTSVTLSNGTLTLYRNVPDAVYVSEGSLTLGSGMNLVTTGGGQIGLDGPADMTVGATATWTAGGTVSVGAAGHNTQLIVAGTLHANALQLQGGIDSSLILQGGGTVTVDAAATIGGNLTGSGTVAGRVNVQGASFVSPSGPMTLGRADVTDGFASAGTLAVGLRTVTLLDADNAEITGAATLNGGVLIAANGVRVSGTGSITGNGLVVGKVTDATPGANALRSPTLAPLDIATAAIGAAEATLMGGSNANGGPFLRNITIAGGTLHRFLPGATVKPYWVDSINGHGTFEGDLFLQGAGTITGPTQFGGLAIRKTGAVGGSLSIGNNIVHVATFGGSDTGTSVNVGVGTLYLDGARGTSGANFAGALSLGGGVVVSALPFTPVTPGDNAFVPSAISGYGTVYAGRLSFAPIPAVNPGGGSVPAHPGSNSFIALSQDPVRPGSSLDLAGAAIYSTGGFVLQGTDKITGFGLVMGHVDDQTGGAGGLVPTGAFPDRTVYLPAGEVRLLATNAPTLGLSNQHAAAATDFYAPVGVTVASTAGSAPIRVHAPFVLANDALIGVPTELVRPGGAVALPGSLRFANSAPLTSATGFTVPDVLSLDGAGALTGAAAHATAGPGYRTLNVTGTISVGDPGAPAGSGFRAEVLNVGKTAPTPVRGDVTLLGAPDAPATLGSANVPFGSVTAPRVLQFQNATLGTSGSANRGSLFAGTHLTGDTLNLPGSSALIAPHITVANVTMAGGTRHALFDNTDYQEYGLITIHGGTWQLDGTVIAGDEVLAEAATTFVLPAGPGDVQTIGNVTIDGTVNAAPGAETRQLVHRGRFGGAGTFNVPVSLDGRSYEISDPDWGSDFIITNMYAGPADGYGLMTFNRSLTVRNATISIPIGGNQRGVSYTAVDVHGTLDADFVLAEFDAGPDEENPVIPQFGEIYHIVSVDRPALKNPDVGTSTYRFYDIEFVAQNDVVNGRSIMVTRKTPDDLFIWFADSDEGDLSDQRNWSNNLEPDVYGGETLKFTSAITAPRTIPYGSAYATHVVFDSPLSYTLGQGTGLTLTGAGYGDGPDPEDLPTLEVVRGSHTLAGRLYVTEDAVITIAAGAALNLVPGQTEIDLGHNVLKLTGPGATAAARVAWVALIGAAYDHGRWDLPGIYAFAAQPDPNFNPDPATAIGYADDGTSLTMRLTWYGDLNLDGFVNGADRALLQSALLQPAGPHTWTTADLNYDGKLTADDLALFALGAALSAGRNAADVPEPGVGAVLASASAIFAFRRPRRR